MCNEKEEEKKKKTPSCFAVEELVRLDVFCLTYEYLHTLPKSHGYKVDA